MSKKGQTFKQYLHECRLNVIVSIREHKLSYTETIWKYFHLCLLFVKQNVILFFELFIKLYQICFCVFC